MPEVTLGLEAGGDAAATVHLLDQRRQRGLQAEVVERRRAQAPRQVEKLLHRPRGQRAGFRELGRDRRIVGAAAQRLEPQQQPGQRLVDLVVEIAGDPGALLGVQRRARRASPLGLEALEHLVEGALEAEHLLGAPGLDQSDADAGLLRSASSICVARRSSGSKRRDSSRMLIATVAASANPSTSPIEALSRSELSGFE